MDLDGNLKDLSNYNNKDHAIHFVNPLASYTVIRIEIDPNTNEKR